jgi:LPXTG-site transpeptidase (sortase) family protein
MSDNKPARRRRAAKPKPPAPQEMTEDFDEVLDDDLDLDETALDEQPPADVELDDSKLRHGQQQGVRHRLYRVPIIGTIAYMLWPPRRTGGMWRRGISGALAVIAVLGIGMAAYPWAGESYPGFYRVPVEKLIEWSNFLSDLQTNRLQDQLAKEFNSLSGLATREGDPLTRFEIPKLGVDTIVVQGISESALKAGAGHYPSTPLPGQNGNVAIAGHRTTYGRPFNRIDQLKVGDAIVLTTPAGKYTYKVSRPPFITSPYDWTIVANSKKPLLTLTACHPKGSARQRLVVRAELVKRESVRPSV